MFNHRKKAMQLALATSVAFLVPVAALADWTGPYGGVALSYGDGKSEDTSYGPGSFGVKGSQFSGFLGYNWQSDSLVYGGELSYAVGNVDGSDGAFMRPLKISNTAMLKARIGYDSGAFLPYGFIGAASSKFKADHSGGGTNLADKRLSGFAFGVGVDYSVNNKTFVRAELSRVNYKSGTLNFGGTDPHDIGSNGVTTLSVGLGIRF